MSKRAYYLTTTLPYVNSSPHVGFALEIIQADVLARYHASLGDEVFFNTGTDEHGKKIYEKALEEGKDPQQYTDEYAAKFDALKHALNLSYNHFIRTTAPHHKQAAQALWKLCDKNGFIAKGTYKAKYCVGCELEKSDSDLIDGKCPLHPTKELELIEEENYFFKFSDPRIRDGLIAHLDKYPDFVVPSHRQKEIRNFIEGGLQDFSISRVKEKMPWGVAVPGDDSQVMYVWFDALTNYISTLGWPEETENFSKYWGTVDQPNAVQVAGKDNLRQQSSMWQAMLIAAGLPLTRQILIHGFITSGGQKMSKSLGNVVDPIEYSKKYGVDALRYYLVAKMDPFEDSDFTQEKFEDVYKADLQNGLGNLVARIQSLASETGLNYESIFNKYTFENDIEFQDMRRDLDLYRFNIAIDRPMILVRHLDYRISEDKIWKHRDDKSKYNDLVENYVSGLAEITEGIKIFLPQLASEIKDRFSGVIEKKGQPLFPRLV